MAFEFGNLLKGVGAGIGAIPGVGTAVGTGIAGVGSLYNALFGTDVTSNSQNTNNSIKALQDLYAQYGIDPSKPFVSHEEKIASPWETTQGRVDQGFANTLQTGISAQSSALNNALAQMGLSSGVGSTGMKLGINMLAPMMEQMNNANTNAAMAYTQKLGTSYEDRMKPFADIASQGAGVSSSNQTAAYRSSELDSLAGTIDAYKSANYELYPEKKAQDERDYELYRRLKQKYG